MTKLFIAHSSQDDEFVRKLRQALADHGIDGWIDSRECVAAGAGNGIAAGLSEDTCAQPTDAASLA
ncbi:MAG TPA: hypothetical protein VJ751_03745 [Pyrinomonadaceae bacterium]|nr:hypothetical protein [Pyrinomonadaceae bacterium]